MDRRTFVRIFVKGAAAAASGSFTFGPGLFDGGRARAQSLQAGGSVQGARPNILVIKVDQLRFPSVFPPGIKSVDDFLKAFMPNLYQLWRNGVKFASHYTAACACTPRAAPSSAACILSRAGWSRPSPPRPASRSRAALADPRLPDLRQAAAPGRLPDALRRQVACLHSPPEHAQAGGLRLDGLTWPDPTGSNLQGTYGDYTYYYTNPINGNRIYAPFRNDADIATQGAQWLQQNASGQAAPWRLTVSFVNPHDKEFFWAGTESTYNGLFDAQSNYQPFTPYSTPGNPPYVPWDTDQLKARRPSTWTSRPTGSRRIRSRRTSRPRRRSAACSRRRAGAASRTTPPSRASPSIRIHPPLTPRSARTGTHSASARRRSAIGGAAWTPMPRS